MCRYIVWVQPQLDKLPWAVFVTNKCTGWDPSCWILMWYKCYLFSSVPTPLANPFKAPYFPWLLPMMARSHILPLFSGPLSYLPCQDKTFGLEKKKKNQYHWDTLKYCTENVIKPAIEHSVFQCWCAQAAFSTETGDSCGELEKQCLVFEWHHDKTRKSCLLIFFIYIYPPLQPSRPRLPPASAESSETLRAPPSPLLQVKTNSAFVTFEKIAGRLEERCL